jgi:hypothetical protein
MITSSTFLLLMYYEAVTSTTEKRSTLFVDDVGTIDVVHVRDSGSRSCKLVEERQALEV